METSSSTSVPQVIEMVKYTENLNSFHIWVIICHIAVRRHSWINQVYPLSLVKRKLSQFVTCENWGLCIVIPILSIKMKESWMYQKLDSYENKEYLLFNIDCFAFNFLCRHFELFDVIYGKRQTWISATWPGFPLTCFQLFFTWTSSTSSFTLFSSTRIVLDCFYLPIFYFEKFLTSVCRLPFAVYMNDTWI